MTAKHSASRLGVIDPVSSSDAVSKSYADSHGGSGGGGTTSTYSTAIGDGSTTSIAINHGLGTRDVQISVYDAITYEDIDCDKYRTGLNIVTLVFGTAPATNSLVAAITAGGAAATGGGGDASTNTSTSVDSEVALFSGTGGKTLKRATLSGIPKLASGVLGSATAGTDYVAPGGALGTPSSGNLANCTFPTLNQNTTGSAATLATARNIDGQAFNGSADVTVIAPGTHAATAKTTPVDADEFPIVDTAASNVLKKVTFASLKTWVKSYYDSVSSVLTNKDLTSGTNTFPTLNQNTTGTAAGITGKTTPAGALVGTTDAQVVTHKDLTDATNTFPTLNQNTTGSAATLTTSRNIDGQAFNGSADITVIAPGTHAASAKTTPVDADELPLVDSAASNVLKKLLFSDLKAAIKSYYDSVTSTLTNKRVTPRVGGVASSATPTINTDTVDVYGLTAQAVDITSFTSNLSGTATDGQKLWIYIVGTASRAITWGASFENGPATLPTTTSGTTRLDVGLIWNAATSKWRCVAQGSG